MNILVNLISSKKDANNPYHGGNEYANTIIINIVETNKKVKKNHLYFWGYSDVTIDLNVLKIIQADQYSRLVYYSPDCNQVEKVIKKYKIDKFFDPLGVGLGSNEPIEAEVIFTIHGLRPLEMPTDINEFFLESRIKYILKTIFKRKYAIKVKKSFINSINLKAKSKKIIVVSEHTKNTLIGNFNIDSKNINVLYSPEKLTPLVDREDEILFFKKHKDILPVRYFLLVSSRRWVKNAYRAIKAFDELIDMGRLKYKVVITGSNKKIEKIIRNKEMFILMDYINSESLEILYKNAYAFVYPSLNEGFGYPPLEAMKYNTPVVASMITSIPEITGNAALGFNPFSISELKARIVQIQNDDILYQQLQENGASRFKLINARQKEDLIKLVNIILA